LENWRDGRIKLHVTSAILRHRREHPALFRDGAYMPLALEGEQAGRFIAFLRQYEKEWLVVVVAIRLGPDADLARMGQGTRVVLPAGAPGAWTNILARQGLKANEGRLELASALGGLPIAVVKS
jgi:(1->4)-alpha-D-glucan 1-alpha-D-glucosylmutase